MFLSSTEQLLIEDNHTKDELANWRSHIRKGAYKATFYPHLMRKYHRNGRRGALQAVVFMESGLGAHAKARTDPLGTPGFDHGPNSRPQYGLTLGATKGGGRTTHVKVHPVHAATMPHQERTGIACICRTKKQRSLLYSGAVLKTAVDFLGSASYFS
jgi:hypothetical protein